MDRELHALITIISTLYRLKLSLIVTSLFVLSSDQDTGTSAAEIPSRVINSHEQLLVMQTLAIKDAYHLHANIAPKTRQPASYTSP